MNADRAHEGAEAELAFLGHGLVSCPRRASPQGAPNNKN
jgi:hypothetical protein